MKREPKMIRLRSVVLAGVTVVASFFAGLRECPGVAPWQVCQAEQAVEAFYRFCGTLVVGHQDAVALLAAPPHAAGPVDLTVTNASGAKGTLRRAFTYVEAAVTAPPKKRRAVR